MEQDVAASKIAEELIKNGLLARFNKQEALAHLERLFAIGFDRGRKQTAHGKPVTQIDYKGNIVRDYDDITSAAKTIGVDKSAISKAVLGKVSKVGGYYWRLK